MRSTNPGFVPDSPFSRPLPPAWTEFFSKFPKAELHCHLLGTTGRETFIGKSPIGSIFVTSGKDM